MISFRCLFVLLPLLALAACDNDPAPPSAPVVPPKPRVSTPAAAVAPAPVVAPAAKPATNPTAEPTANPTTKPTAEPAAKRASEPVKASPPPKPVVSKPSIHEKPKASVAKAAEPAPRLELDLSLPTELLEPTESVEAFSELPATLLPPLFDEQNAEGSPFQLQGKLISNERGDEDYWESLEGAELQFEFKR